MEAAPFVAFGLQHLLTLLAILLISAALPFLALSLPHPRTAGIAGGVIACLILTGKIVEVAWYRKEGVPWPWLLPLHLCDLAALAVAAALIHRRRYLFELAYFWGMAGTTQALLTPDLRLGFPDASFWFFFVPHGLVIAGVFFATAALGLRPAPGCLNRVFLATLAFCIPAGLANWVWGTNYMYLREKPEAATLLDFLGPWPWYILALVPVAWIFLALWYAPFRWRSR